MVKCTFTGKEEHPFKGIHLIKNDGTVDYYSSRKAMKNALKLGRDKRKLKWTEAYREERVKLAQREEVAAKAHAASAQKPAVSAKRK